MFEPISSSFQCAIALFYPQIGLNTSFRGLPESRSQGCETIHRFAYKIKPFANVRGRHPWLLDSGNPCRNDGAWASYHCDLWNKQ